MKATINRFIAFEGIDGCGKTTQIGMLASLIRKHGIDVVETKEPMPNTEIEKRIRKELDEGIPDPFKFQMLNVDARRIHVNEVIAPALGDGKYVITDRYMMSTFAYGRAQGLDNGRLDALRKANEEFPKPMLTFLLDIDPLKSMRRTAERAMRLKIKQDNFESKLGFVRRVRASYLIEAEHPYANGSVHVIDADKSVDDVHNSIADILSLGVGVSNAPGRNR